ncbi:DUF6397 family protein [Streptomyces sp. NPDC048664]|uniref:DUF6397 family protein n=1 Tax=Streptomyces sp. NPDC048664 TaxID=3154505 RepID=UPI00341C9342
MSGHTITCTHTTISTARDDSDGALTGSAVPRSSLSLGGAARELQLKKGELELAMHLGQVRGAPGGTAGGRRIARAEIDRVRGQEGFPDRLRGRLRTVGTQEGAALIDVAPARFTRLGRLGLVVPVKWYLNRYRAVVWLYLAEELQEFAAQEANEGLLTGRTPKGLREQLAEGLDLRPRNWRGRHLGFQLRQTRDPWARAAVVASLLDTGQVEAVVPDPRERAELSRLRPPPLVSVPPDSPAARVVESVTTAQDPDEIRWFVADLERTLDEARRHRSATGTPPPARHDRATAGRTDPRPGPTPRESRGRALLSPRDVLRRLRGRRA